MDLFKNSVGRPSNEIKKKRKIFITSIIVLCMILISALAITLTKVDTNRLKGAASLKAKDVAVDMIVTDAWWSGKGSKYKNFGIYVTEDSKSASYFIVVSCKTLEACKANNAYDKAGSGNRTGKIEAKAISNRFAKIYYTDETKMAGTKFFIRVTSYNKNGKWLAVDVYEVEIKDKKSACLIKLGTCNLVEQTWRWGKTNNDYVKQEKISMGDSDARFFVDEINCTYEHGICRNKKKFKLSVYGNKRIQSYKIAICNKPNDCNWEKVSNVNRSKLLDVKEEETTIRFDETNASIVDRYFYIRVLTYVDKGSTWAGNYLYEVKPSSYNTNKKKFDFKTSLISSTMNNKIINYDNKGPDGTISLNCPTKASVNIAFKCTTNQDGVKLSTTAIEGLNPRYTLGRVHSISDVLSWNVEFSDNLFKYYPNQIKNDSSGKYITVAMVASKSGFASVKKYIKIYKNTKLELTCPSTTNVENEFKCTTNMPGVKISIPAKNGLASGYSSTFTTTDHDKTKSIKFTNNLFVNYSKQIKKDSKGKQYIKAAVTAEKTGYTKVTKYINVYK